MQDPQTSSAVRADAQSDVSLREAQAAARVKVTIDRRRGRTTPQWIKDLAEGRRTA